MSNSLLKRIASAIPLIVFGALYIYFAPKYIFLVITGGILWVCLWEYAGAVRKKYPICPIGVYVTGLSFFIGLILNGMGQQEASIVFYCCSTVSIFLSILFTTDFKFKGIGWYLLPLPWICLPLYLLSQVRFSFTGYTGSNLIAFIIIIAAVNDTCAYFGGSRFGKRKLAPKISPNKTVEGSLFGLIGGFLVGYGFLYLVIPVYRGNLLMFLIIPIMIIAAQVGDLFESFL